MAHFAKRVAGAGGGDQHDLVAEAGEFVRQPFDLPLGAAIALAGDRPFRHQRNAHQTCPVFRVASPTFSGERGCNRSSAVSRLLTMPIAAIRTASNVVQPGPSSGLALNRAKEL